MKIIKSCARILAGVPRSASTFTGRDRNFSIARFPRGPDAERLRDRSLLRRWLSPRRFSALRLGFEIIGKYLPRHARTRPNDDRRPAVISVFSIHIGPAICLTNTAPMSDRTRDPKD